MTLNEEPPPQHQTPVSAKEAPSPSPQNLLRTSQSDSSQPKSNGISPSTKNPKPSSNSPSPSLKDQILSISQKIAAQPVQNSNPSVWAVLTAISNKSRKRPQGVNIYLTDDEHRIGRVVEDKQFRIESHAVSGSHCKIYREKVVDHVSVFLKDTSTNGTFLNWEKLKKNAIGAKLKHGDIVSFAAAPQHELAFAFVYREVLNSTLSTEGTIPKRKAEEFVSENKRLKGIGVGAPEGPISLDDVRSLQRSNMELRKELESHVQTIESIRNENRAALARHEIELKELKDSVSQSYRDEMKELQLTLEVKQKELLEFSTVSAERQQAIVDLNERLNASIQSRIDKDEIINSQKATIAELEGQLDEERNQRREEREKTLADHKAALQRAHLEAQEELNRQCEVASRQERELKEVINKLQEADKENRLLVEFLRGKLEDTRESLVVSEKKVRQLEAQVHEEQQVSANERKKVEALEKETRRLRKELESEKVAREEAWAKVSALELEMASAIRDLSIEKQKFQGARERIILRETQLREFYATTEEIFPLFAKQQEKLKAMQRTLEDEDNYENMSVDTDLNTANEKTNEDMVREKATPHRSKNVKESSAASTPRVDRTQVESSSDEANVTEKHECDLRSQEEGNFTQDLECTSADRSVKGAFGSDIDGVGTAPEFEGDPIETERVLETESPGGDTNLSGRMLDLSKSIPFAGDTMQLDDEIHAREGGRIQQVDEEIGHCSQSSNLPESQSPKAMEDTEGAAIIRTEDLITSEVAGSWAINTDPSFHGENESPRSGDRDGAGNYDESAAPLLCCSDGQGAGSQIVPPTPTATKMSQERQALNEMIEIVAPGFREQFNGGDSAIARDDDQASTSASDTEGDSDHDGDINGVDGEGGSTSDVDIQDGNDQGDEDNEIDETDDDKQEDSIG